MNHRKNCPNCNESMGRDEPCPECNHDESKDVCRCTYCETKDESSPVVDGQGVGE